MKLLLFRSLESLEEFRRSLSIFLYAVSKADGRVDDAFELLDEKPKSRRLCRRFRPPLVARTEEGRALLRVDVFPPEQASKCEALAGVGDE